MLVNEISLWGAALIAVLVVVAMIALAFVDRPMLRRMLVIFAATVVQMAIVGAVVLLAYKTFAWWTYLLWYLLILFLSVCWVLFPIQFMWKKALKPVSVAMLVGSIVVGGSTLLCLPISVFMTVYSVLMACLTASMIQTMINYQRSLHGSPMNAEAQKQKLSWRESVLPQVRSMAQPLVMVMPMLYAGMLLGGVSAYVGLIVIFLLIGASFVANVLTGVITLLLLRQGSREV
jgi:ABC-type iron transport system FetAB permease component